MNIYKIATVFMVLIIAGCTTPPEVKQLSVKQMVFFDYATLGRRGIFVTLPRYRLTGWHTAG